MPISQAYHRHITDTQISQILCIPSTLVLTFNPRVNRIRYVSDVWLWRVPLHLTLSQMVHFYGYASIYKCQQILVVKETPHNKQTHCRSKEYPQRSGRKNRRDEIHHFPFRDFIRHLRGGRRKSRNEQLENGKSFNACFQCGMHMLGNLYFL